MATIPTSHLHLLQEKVVASLGTVLDDGQPQVHPVWVDYDGGHVRINTALGRQKDKNLQARPQATILLVAPDNPYFWMEIRGRVAERVEGGLAEEHIDQLAYKYFGQESYSSRAEGEVRILYKIVPERVLTGGADE